MKIKKILMGAMMGTICMHSQAQDFDKPKDKDLTIGLHLRSYHSSGDFNNNNYGVYVRKGNLVMGDYYNSIKKNSFYAGYLFEMKTPKVPLVDSVGLLVGGVTGYDTDSKIAGFTPMALPSVKFLVTDDFGFRILWIPYTHMTSSNVFHLSIEKSF